MSVFKELLSIKAFRESKAELEVRKQRQTLADAKASEREREQALERWREYALRHERDLYADLCRRVVQLRDIEQVQQSVVDMRGQERQHEERVREAAKLCAHEAARLDECKRVLGEAARAKRKFVELAQAHADEQIKELERREDAELEEAAETRRDSVEWDEYHGEDAA